MFKGMLAALAALTMLGTPVAGQVDGAHDHDAASSQSTNGSQGMMTCPMMDQGMMQMMMMMGQGMESMSAGTPGPAMLLRMRDAFDLTDEQVSRLEAMLEEARALLTPEQLEVLETHRAGMMSGEMQTHGSQGSSDR